MPYKPSSLSSFSEDIANYVFQTKIKMPSNVKTYDGLEDPEDHLRVFTGAATVERWNNAEYCHMFMQTLIGPARLWFCGLPTRIIKSFDDLYKSFLANFTPQKRCTRDATVMHQIQQKDHEVFRAFIERFKMEGLMYSGATKKMRVSSFMNAIKPKKLLRRFHENNPKTMEEAFERAESFLKGGEALEKQASRKREQGSWREPPPPNKRSRFQPFVDRRPFRPYERRRFEDRKRSPRPNRNQDKDKQIFILLTKTPQEILSTEEVKYNFRPPRPLSKAASKRDASKFCPFHNDTGHHTNDCY
ncbi:uncharacterized protein LOC110913844 [Helianthus annuus]|uniref:uncharacterized protein LOC110913844 n=1 Tax=Helianthus annuus TaxID=4232 RepID=UPI000B8FA552|nr:uncharacterized protein LOC110913844 [Helianthus annuus]